MSFSKNGRGVSLGNVKVGSLEPKLDTKPELSVDTKPGEHTKDKSDAKESNTAR